jgi:hypothetical protein
LISTLSVGGINFSNKDLTRDIKKKINIVTFFFAGSILGNLPMVIFDLRHDFYQFKTGFTYFTQIMLGGRGEGFSYYQFLYLWIIFAIAGGWILSKLFTKNVFLALIPAAIYILVSFNTPFVNFSKPTGMPDGLIARDVYTTAEIINKESEKCSSFNVLETQDFDTRAHILRYPLIFKYNKIPLGVIDYRQSDCVFSLSADNYDFQNADIWEFNELRPFSVSKIANIGQGYSLYKLIND